MKIEPNFDHDHVSGIDLTPCINFFQQLLERVLPADFLSDYNSAIDSEKTNSCFANLDALLPIFQTTAPEEKNRLFTFTLMCRAELAHGAGRYISDTLSRWLIPGKMLPFSYAQSLCFHFSCAKDRLYFINYVVLQVTNETDISIIRNNLSDLSSQIRLNIAAVRYARSIFALKQLPLEQKRTLVQDHLKSVIDRPSKTFDLNLFDQMEHFLMQLTEESKREQVKEQFFKNIDQQISLYERDIFHETDHFAKVFSKKFIATRTSRHIVRIISSQYLINKFLEHEASIAPHERHLALKFFRTTLQDPFKRQVLALIVGISFLKEYELFGERHIFNALQHALPGIKKIKDSYLFDRRWDRKIRLFYLEVEKENGAIFTTEEMQELKKRLYHGLKDGFQTISHPIFMQRNEEEVMRYIIILSQELKYTHDIPQMVILFEMQSSDALCFTVILLKISNQISLEAIFLTARTLFKFHDHQIHHAGTLRKRHKKEAHVFRASIDKKLFLRTDYSLNLYQARHTLTSELTLLLGEIRDYNGGIFSKQQEVLEELNRLLGEQKNGKELLVERFFYSLSPPLRQSLLPPFLLKEFFKLILEALNHELLCQSRHIAEYGIILYTTKQLSTKEKIIENIKALEIPSIDLTTSFLSIHETHFIGYLYKCTQTEWEHFCQISHPELEVL